MFSANVFRNRSKIDFGNNFVLEFGSVRLVRVGTVVPLETHVKQYTEHFNLYFIINVAQCLSHERAFDIGY